MASPTEVTLSLPCRPAVLPFCSTHGSLVALSSSIRSPSLSGHLPRPLLLLVASNRSCLLLPRGGRGVIPHMRSSCFPRRGRKMGWWVPKSCRPPVPTPWLQHEIPAVRAKMWQAALGAPCSPLWQPLLPLPHCLPLGASQPPWRLTMPFVTASAPVRCLLYSPPPSGPAEAARVWVVPGVFHQLCLALRSSFT